MLNHWKYWGADHRSVACRLCSSGVVSLEASLALGRYLVSCSKGAVVPP
jgi:hypothetical protein